MNLPSNEEYTDSSIALFPIELNIYPRVYIKIRQTINDRTFDFSEGSISTMRVAFFLVYLASFFPVQATNQFQKFEIWSKLESTRIRAKAILRPYLESSWFE